MKIEEIERLLEDADRDGIPVDAPHQIIRSLIAQVKEAERGASSLATFLWKKYYKEESPNWGLCDSAAGIITQIDNMITGIHQKERKQAFLEAAEMNDKYSFAAADLLRRKAEERRGKS